MDYLATHPYVPTHFYASDIVLNLESDSAYLVLKKYRIWAAAWYIFSQEPDTVTTPLANAPFHVMCNTIKPVMASAAESETGGIFMGGQRYISTRITTI